MSSHVLLGNTLTLTLRPHKGRLDLESRYLYEFVLVSARQIFLVGVDNCKNEKREEKQVMNPIKNRHAIRNLALRQSMKLARNVSH